MDTERLKKLRCEIKENKTRSSCVATFPVDIINTASNQLIASPHQCLLTWVAAEPSRPDESIDTSVLGLDLCSPIDLVLILPLTKTCLYSSAVNYSQCGWDNSEKKLKYDVSQSHPSFPVGSKC